jgi:hypothetical protein
MDWLSNIYLPKVFEQNFNYFKLEGATPNILGYLNNLFAGPSLNIVVAIFGAHPPTQCTVYILIGVLL